MQVVRKTQTRNLDSNRAWFSIDKGLAYYDGASWAYGIRQRGLMLTAQVEQVRKSMQKQ
jgi:hypothetical protein